MGVEIKNLTKTKVSDDFLLRVVLYVLEQEQKQGAKFAIALVEPPVIQYLNKTYRKQNSITDVLAFSQGDVKTREPSESVEEDYLGDLAICLQAVENNSKEYKVPFIQELTRVLIHGILHLLGYEHEGEQGQDKLMQKKEKAYLVHFFH